MVSIEKFLKDIEEIGGGKRWFPESTNLGKPQQAMLFLKTDRGTNIALYNTLVFKY